MMAQDAELDPLSEFHERWNALWSKAREYLSAIAIETFPADTPGWRSVPSEWEEEQPERFRRSVKKLHGQEAQRSQPPCAPFPFPFPSPGIPHAASPIRWSGSA
jgi:hypothetical protein